MTELKHSIQPNQQYITEVKSELGIALARKRCFWHLLKLGSSRVLQLLSPLSASFSSFMHAHLMIDAEA